MSDRAIPRRLMIVLGVFSVVSFALGVYLELHGFLAPHPYLVNLLSSVTGFSTSALIVSLFVNRIIEQANLQKWEGALAYIVASIKRRITAVSFIIAREHGIDSDDFDLDDVSVGAGRYMFLRTPSLATLEQRLETTAGEIQSIYSVLLDHPSEHGYGPDWITSIESARRTIIKRYDFLASSPRTDVRPHMDRALGDLIPRLAEISRSPNLNEATYRLDNGYIDWEDYRFLGNNEALIAAADECLVILQSDDEELTFDPDDRARFSSVVRDYLVSVKSTKTFVNGLTYFVLALEQFAPTKEDPYQRRPPVRRKRKLWPVKRRRDRQREDEYWGAAFSNDRHQRNRDPTNMLIRPSCPISPAQHCRSVSHRSGRTRSAPVQHGTHSQSDYPQRSLGQ